MPIFEPRPGAGRLGSEKLGDRNKKAPSGGMTGGSSPA